MTTNLLVWKEFDNCWCAYLGGVYVGFYSLHNGEYVLRLLPTFRTEDNEFESPEPPCGPHNDANVIHGTVDKIKDEAERLVNGWLKRAGLK